MAKLLIQSMDSPFDPAAYKDEYQVRLKELIEAKIAGKEIVSVEPESKGNIINLMDALKASLEQTQKDKEETQTVEKAKSAPAKSKTRSSRSKAQQNGSLDDESKASEDSSGEDKPKRTRTRKTKGA